MAHNDTVFAQVLKLVPRHEFESLARKHKSGRMSRSMTRWGQFVAMGMAQLTGRCSLRDIVSNLAAQSCKLYHLGVGVVTRSSLARVNAEKPWEMYEELHGRLLGRCQAKAPGHGYRFKAKLFSVDSTTIDLCLSAFPWAKFRRTKGAVKVHVGLDHEGYLPTFVRVTNGKTSDIEAARALTLPKGSIVAADRAYVDFAWIDSLISEGIHLVTRLKRGIKYGVVETREVNAKRGVTSDETIEFTSAKGRKQCPHRLRRIGYHDRKTGKDYVFLTTHFYLSAKTIADIYKSRWQVELFFKWIKQNLKVKSFVGTSRNAVMTQVWTAMCIYLILSYLKFAGLLDEQDVDPLHLAEHGVHGHKYGVPLVLGERRLDILLEGLLVVMEAPASGAPARVAHDVGGHRPRQFDQVRIVVVPHRRDAGVVRQHIHDGPCCRAGTATEVHVQHRRSVAIGASGTQECGRQRVAEHLLHHESAQRIEVHAGVHERVGKPGQLVAVVQNLAVLRVLQGKVPTGSPACAYGRPVLQGTSHVSLEGIHERSPVLGGSPLGTLLVARGVGLAEVSIDPSRRGRESGACAKKDGNRYRHRWCLIIVSAALAVTLARASCPACGGV